MESAKSGHRTVSGRGRDVGPAAEARGGRFAKADPRPRADDRSARGSEYSSFAAEIHRDLNPRGSLERLVADHVVHSAWKLKANLAKQAARVLSEGTDPDAGPSSKARARPTELDRASRSMREALESLDYLRARPRFGDLEIVPDEAGGEFDILPNEWPVVPFEDADEVSPEGEEVPSWHDRLVFDFGVSDTSPVVKGTWITVGHVVSLIVDGWSWADILRSHPELTEGDIRTCVAYAMAEENSTP